MHPSGPEEFPCLHIQQVDLVAQSGVRGGVSGPRAQILGERVAVGSVVELGLQSVANHPLGQAISQLRVEPHQNGDGGFDVGDAIGLHGQSKPLRPRGT